MICFLEKANRIATALIFASLVTAPVLSLPPAPNECRTAVVKHSDTRSFHRTELYFGRSIPGGGEVSAAEWQRFLADVVTPRFPNGFTIVDAAGQYREKKGL